LRSSSMVANRSVLLFSGFAIAKSSKSRFVDSKRSVAFRRS
jgi:hypothetical protein